MDDQNVTGDAPKYAIGQLWAYRSRPGEPDSTVLINYVEHNDRLGDIYHIGVLGVKVRSPRSESGMISELSHFPVSRETLDKSVTTLVGNRRPDHAYVEGYREWKQAFDDGKAGVFGISVAEIVDIMEQALNQEPV
jgi:hypothetical protein